MEYDFWAHSIGLTKINSVGSWLETVPSLNHYNWQRLHHAPFSQLSTHSNFLRCLVLKFDAHKHQHQSAFDQLRSTFKYTYIVHNTHSSSLRILLKLQTFFCLYYRIKDRLGLRRGGSDQLHHNPLEELLNP